MRIAVGCPCGVTFEVTEQRVADGRGKYCSNGCKYKYRVRPMGLVYRKHKENPTSFKPGRAAPSGPDAPGWKGDAIGYRQLHDWVRTQRPYPEVCERCKKPGYVEWANLSHEYRRDIADWAALCRYLSQKP